MGACVFLNQGLFSLGKFLKVALLGNMESQFLVFLRKLRTAFYSGYTNLHSHQKCGRVPFCPHSCQLLFLSDSMHSNWYEAIIPHCGFDLHFPDDQGCGTSCHMFLGHLFLFGEMSVHILCPFFNQVICFLLLRLMSSLCILNVNPLLDKLFTNIFSHTVGCLFVLLMVSFAVQKLFSLMQSHVFISAVVSFVRGDMFRKKLLMFILRRFQPMLSSKSFMVS